MLFRLRLDLALYERLYCLYIEEPARYSLYAVSNVVMETISSP